MANSDAEGEHPEHVIPEPVMTGAAFRAWRKALGLRQSEAAERLGLKLRMIQYYESGDRAGNPVEIPRAVRLACWALQHGIGDFDGSSSIPVALLKQNPATDVLGER